MSEYIVQHDTMVGIANAVRTLTGTTDALSTSQIASSLNNATITAGNKMPTIYCWGDSLTEGVGGWLATPENIRSTVVSAYPDVVSKTYPCINLGCPGETIQTIMARQGADPMVVGGFTIPASAEDDVVVGYLRGNYFDDNRLGLATASGDLAQPLKEGEAGINPCPAPPPSRRWRTSTGATANTPASSMWSPPCSASSPCPC